MKQHQSPVEIYRTREKEFREFLSVRGSEVIESQNQYEALRFSGPTGWCIIFWDEAHFITYCNAAAQAALKAFDGSEPWRACKATKRKILSDNKWRTLVKRDGECCIYCDDPGSDENPLTKDHIVPATCQGPNHLANLAIACLRCNRAVGVMSAAEKIRFAIAMHIQKAAA